MAVAPRVYLDTCALKRPFDAPADERVTLEAMAVASILDAYGRGEIVIVTSVVLETENARNPDRARRDTVSGFLSSLSERVGMSDALTERAREFAAVGIPPLDAYHTAAAHAGGCDLLVTCDDRFLRAATREGSALPVRVLDPLVAVRYLSEREGE